MCTETVVSKTDHVDIPSYCNFYFTHANTQMGNPLLGSDDGNGSIMLIVMASFGRWPVSNGILKPFVNDRTMFVGPMIVRWRVENDSPVSAFYTDKKPEENLYTADFLRTDITLGVKISRELADRVLVSNGEKMIKLDLSPVHYCSINRVELFMNEKITNYPYHLQYFYRFAEFFMGKFGRIYITASSPPPADFVIGFVSDQNPNAKINSVDH